jgi:hypothetical protein
MAASQVVLQDPALDTTQQDINADAEKMLSDWDARLEGLYQQIQDMLGKLSSAEAGAEKAAVDAKAGELDALGASLNGRAPGSVNVTVQLSTSDELKFVAPLTDRASAVAEILTMFAVELEKYEQEHAEETQSAETEADQPNNP